MFCEKCGTPLLNGKCPKCDGEMVTTKQKKNYGMTIFAVLLSIISIGLLAGGFYLFTSPKTIVLQSITDWKNALKKVSSANSSLTNKMKESDAVGVDLSYQIQLNSQLGLGIDNMDAHLFYNSDQKEKLTQLSLDTSIGGENLLSLDTILKDSTVYVQLKDIMDKYYFTPIASTFSEEKSVTSLSDDEVNTLIDIVTDNMKKMIKSEDLEKSTVNLNLGDKEKKTTKITYHVTKQKVYQLLVSILEDVKKEDSLITTFAEISNTEKNDFVQKIEQSIQSLKDDSKDENLFDYHVYYYGFNNIVMQEIIYQELDVQYYKYSDTKELKIFDRNSQTNYFSFRGVKEKEQYKISGYLTTYSYEGTYVDKEKNPSLDLNIHLNDDMTLMLAFSNKVLNDNEQEFTMAIGFQTPEIEMKKAAELQGKIKYVYDESIDASVLDGAVDINEMTLEERNLIFERLQQNPFLSMLFSSIGFGGTDFIGGTDLDSDVDMGIDDDFGDDFSADYEFGL